MSRRWRCCCGRPAPRRPATTATTAGRIAPALGHTQTPRTPGAVVLDPCSRTFRAPTLRKMTHAHDADANSKFHDSLSRTDLSACVNGASYGIRQHVRPAPAPPTHAPAPTERSNEWCGGFLMRGHWRIILERAKLPNTNHK